MGGLPEDLVRGYGAGVIRAAVPVHNAVARAVAERTGYAPIARAVVGVVTVPRGVGGSDGGAVSRDPVVRRATAVEAPAIGALVASSLKGWHDLIPVGWRFRRVVVDLIRGLARDGRVLVTQDPGGVAIVAGGRGAAVLSALAGSTSQRQSLVNAVISQADAARVAVFAPDRTTVSDLNIVPEPHAWCPEGLVLVEKSLVR